MQMPRRGEGEDLPAGYTPRCTAKSYAESRDIRLTREFSKQLREIREAGNEQGKRTIPGELETNHLAVGESPRPIRFFQRVGKMRETYNVSRHIVRVACRGNASFFLRLFITRVTPHYLFLSR